MPIDDLWYLAGRGPDGQRLPSRRHGRGKRWRVRLPDQPTASFDRKTDAEAHERRIIAAADAGGRYDPAADRLTVGGYAERWLHARTGIHHPASTAKHNAYAVRNHITPTLGGRRLRALTTTDVLDWLRGQSGAPSSVVGRLDLLKAILKAAVRDGLIPRSPADGIRPTVVLGTGPRPPVWVPTAEQVHALAEAMPDQLRAVVWLGAGCGLRVAEALAVEVGPASLDFLGRAVHVRHQIRRLKAYGGLYLSWPKTSHSRATVEMPGHVADALARHLANHPPRAVEVVDLHDGNTPAGRRRLHLAGINLAQVTDPVDVAPLRRTAMLAFSTVRGRPVDPSRGTWADVWNAARDAAGWPADAGFHALRHFYATTLIRAGWDVKRVSVAMRHSTPVVTLNTYAGYWPDADAGTARGVLDAAFDARRSAPTLRAVQDRS